MRRPLVVFRGDRLRAVRIERGLARAAVAHHLGLTEQAYAAIEAGAPTLDAVSLKLLAVLLEISADSLFDVHTNGGRPRPPT